MPKMARLGLPRSEKARASPGNERNVEFRRNQEFDGRSENAQWVLWCGAQLWNTGNNMGDRQQAGLRGAVSLSIGLPTSGSRNRSIR